VPWKTSATLLAASEMCEGIRWEATPVVLVLRVDDQSPPAIV
jgi:hypothetical protein